MSSFKNTFGIFAFLTLASLSGHAKAACTTAPNMPHSMEGWTEKVANSANQGLAGAYANNNCVYKKGAHIGGRPPAPGLPTLHVTVKILPNGPTCHVFDKAPNAQPSDPYPTTC